MAKDVSSTSHGMFVRNATGLVREISFFDSILVNLGPTAIGVGFAISVFYVLATYPGAHLLAGIWITAGFATLIALPYGLLAVAMPRSGADYILVSRVLGAPFGLASSFSFTVQQMLGIAFIASNFAIVGLIPGLAIIGLISGNTGISSLSSTLGGKNWTFAVSVGMLLLATALGALRVRSAMRIQRIGYAIAWLGLLAGLIVMVLTPTTVFVQRFDAIIGGGAYTKLLASAAKTGLAAPDTSWANTIPTIAALGFVFFYCWWSTNYGGELKSARTWRTLGSMITAIIVVAVVLTILSLALFHMTGEPFMAAANALNGSKDYPLPVPPFWVLFVAMAVKSGIFAALLVIAFLFWFPLWTWINLAQPTRAFFAWSFDGLLPAKVASVSDRWHSPVVALGITLVLSAVALVWEIYASTFFAVLALLTVLTIVTFMSVAVAAILVPYLKPDLWKQTLWPVRVFGIPLITLVGVLAFAAEAFMLFVLLSYPALGIPNAGIAMVVIVVVYAAGVGLYYLARGLQQRRGVDIRLNFTELPPE